MDLQLLVDNLTNPALLFFFLGLLAVQLKSDLAIPPSSSKFISFYLLLHDEFVVATIIAAVRVVGEYRLV